jgi:hypothetical protein
MDEWPINPRNVELVIHDFACQIEKMRRIKDLNDTEIMAGFCCGVVSMSDIKSMQKKECVEFFEKIYDMCEKDK